jgi:uncharacterized protein (DUF2062 family)
VHWWASFRRLLRFQYLRLLRLKASTHSIAMGLAVGIFVGCLPVIPFQTIAAVVMAFVFRGSKVAAALGTWISNPVNMIPFYTMLYYIGSLVMPVQAHFNPHHLELEAMLHQGWEIVVVMFAGGILLGVPLAFLTYIVTFRMVNAYRQRRMIKLLKQYEAGRKAREHADMGAGR